MPINPTTLSCTPGGAGICLPFAENALFTITDNSFTVSEDAGSSYTAAAFNGIEYVDTGIHISGVTLTVSTVPELSTWAMLALGFAGLGFAGYRTSRRSAPIAP